jgi:hypothetical protein
MLRNALLSRNRGNRSLKSLIPQVARLFCLVLVLGVSLGAFAQSGQGSITGQVTDPKGALVPKAVVTITNTDTKVSITTKTNSQGIYQVGSLNPANYDVTVTAPGFERSTMLGVTVQAAASVSIDVPLKPGAANDSVTVTAQDSLLSKDTSDVITTVDHSLVEALPYPERSSLEAALLVPGVSGDPTAVGGVDPENPGIYGGSVTPGAAISISGAPPGTNSIYVDGSDVTQASYARAGINLSGKLVQETTVVTGGLSAKFGRTGGGAIVQASRAGGSDYHGSITWRHTDPFFQATPLGQAPEAPPHLHENFYGFYVGGPVWIPKVYNGRRKTFFFVGVEPARLSNANGARGSFLTPDDLAGHLNNTLPLLNLSVLKASGYAAAIAAPRSGGLYYHAPATGAVNAANPNCALHPGVPCGNQYATSGQYQPIPNNDVSGALAQNPFAQYVMSLMPTPSNPGPYITFDNPQGTYDSIGNNANYLRGVQNTDNRYSIRVDHQFGNNDQMFARYTVIPVLAVRYNSVAQSNPISGSPTDSARNFDIAIGYTHIFQRGIVNNMHYSFLRAKDVRTVPAVDMTQDFGAAYGLTPATRGYGFPYLGGFNVSGVSYLLGGGVAPGATGPSQQTDENFIFADDVTWQRGRHLIQFGVDLRWIQSNQYNNGYVTGGAYTFTQSTTNNGSSGGAPLATFDLGEISSFIDSPIVVPAYYRWRYDATYLQDDWRVTSKVTLNLGMRYNVETPRMEKFNNQPIIALNQNNLSKGVSSAASLCFSYACGLKLKTIWPINWKEFEPRIGISIAPTSRTTIRAAYTLVHLPLTGYYNQPLPDISGGGTLGGNVGGQYGGEIVDSITNPVMTPPSAYASLNAARHAPIITAPGITPIYVDQTNAVPYTQSYNLTLQYAPRASTLVTVTYQGLKGVHLVNGMNGAAAGDINVPTIPAITAQIKASSNLSAAATGTNPYGLTVNGSLLTENALQALNPYQNFFNTPIPNDFERQGALGYNALLVSVTHRQGRNLSLLANYSWSKSIDNVADTNYGNNLATGSPQPQDPFNLKAERSVSVIDQPSRLKVGYNYTLPIGTGQKFHTGVRLIDNIIGNLSTSGIYTVQSGFPNYVVLGSTGYFTSVTPSGKNGCTAATNAYCVEAALPSGYTLRPNLVKGVPLINKNWKHGGGGVFSSTFVPYLNPAAFGCTNVSNGSLTSNSVCPSPGDAGNPAMGIAPNPQLGNAPRTLSDARTPRETFFDARVQKGFDLHKGYRLNLTGTFTDAFNHPVYFSTNSKNIQNAVTVNASATAIMDGPLTVNPGMIQPNAAATTFGATGNNTGAFSRVIRVGAELTF